MYKPNDMNRPQYPVFRKVDGKIIPLFSGKAIVTVMVVILLCIAVFTTTGSITKTIEVNTTALEQNNELTDLKAQRAAMAYQQTRQEMEKLENEQGDKLSTLSIDQEKRYNELQNDADSKSLILASYTDEQQARLIISAQENDINPDTNDEELKTFVKMTRTEEVPVIDDFVRGIFLIFLPIGITLALVAEYEGNSLSKALMRMIYFKRKQHVFYYAKERG